jgi:hypothetical protein
MGPLRIALLFAATTVLAQAACTDFSDPPQNGSGILASDASNSLDGETVLQSPDGASLGAPDGASPGTPDGGDAGTSGGSLGASCMNVDDRFRLWTNKGFPQPLWYFTFDVATPTGEFKSILSDFSVNLSPAGPACGRAAQLGEVDFTQKNPPLSGTVSNAIGTLTVWLNISAVQTARLLD